MENILNLALKKDVFNELKNGTTNEILIEKTNWWKKRLMDLDTGRFKKFDIACVTSGSSNKSNYDIENISLRDNSFVITVKPEVSEVVEPEIVEPKVVEPVTIEPAIIVNDEVGDDNELIQNEDGGIDDEQEELSTEEESPTEIKEDDETTEDDEALEGDFPVDEPKEETKSVDIKKVISNTFNKFCELSDVFVVNMPYVTIRPNGQIIGCKRRLIADRDNDVRFTFTIKELVKYPSDSDSNFALQVVGYINKLLKNNYVFVNKHASGFKEDKWGNLIFTIVATTRKKYIFPRQ